MTQNRLLYFNKAEMHRRGWTDKLMADYELVPDKEAPNPLYPNSHPMKLYLKSKVKEIEGTELFQRKLRWTTWFRGHMKELARQRREALG